MWWGFSQALDLLDEYESIKEEGGDGDKDNATLNVLLIGQYDGRHMLKTIAQKYRHKEAVDLNLYVFEPLLENVARELLFITLALQPSELIGINEKTLFFMEMFGNTLLRPTTAKYLTKLSKQLLNMVTNINYAEKILPYVSLNLLKYKERDQLEVIMKYWASADTSFDILKAWDSRLRKSLGTRYDSRTGVVDWDYHMRYHCNGAEVLQLQEYKKFREKGVAFHFDDTDPCIPNCSLASAIFSAGSKILNYGYMGDIVTGPYIPFGISCEDEDMFKKVNGHIRKTSTQITERNLLRIFHEIQNKAPFVPPQNLEESTAALFIDDTNKLKIMHPDPKEKSDDKITIKDSIDMYESIPLEDSRIIFLPTTALKDYMNKPEFENFFDLVYVSQTMVMKHIQPEVVKMFKPNCKMIVDTPKFILSYRKEDLAKFKTDLETSMEACSFKLIGSYDSEKDEFVRFNLNKP